MPKPLPPTTIEALSPPPASGEYAFFENVVNHPFQADANGLELRNAWWLMDAAFLAYSSPETIVKTFSPQTFGVNVSVRNFSGLRSTQCYVASSDKWIVIAFRGTQVDDFWASVVDWSVDARFVPVNDSHGDAVHAGFLAAVQEVWSDVVSHVATLQSQAVRPLWITGHSLGAALATVAANMCSDQPDALHLQAVYTYGSPRVGDRGFGRRIPAPLWRFRNNSDLVTHVPLGLVFRHAGTLGLIDGAGAFHADPSSAEEAIFEAAAARLSASDAHHLRSLLSGADFQLHLPGVLADHAPINYAVRLWNCYEAAAE